MAELQGHIQDQYHVVFDSKQSYYTLFKQAGISWKKTQKHNPKADPALVQKKQEISDWLAAYRDEIVSGHLVVRTTQNWYINADCNGAANIIRKVATTLGFDLSGVGSGALLTPLRVCLWTLQESPSLSKTSVARLA